MPVIRNSVKRFGAGKPAKTAPLSGLKVSGGKQPTSIRSKYVFEEIAFQKDVIKIANARGWQHFHVENPRGCVPGWPDLVLLRLPRLLFVELKSSRGHVSPAQQWWLSQFAQLGEEIAQYTKRAPVNERPSVESYVWAAGITPWNVIYDILGVVG